MSIANQTVSESFPDFLLRDEEPIVIPGLWETQETSTGDLIDQTQDVGDLTAWITGLVAATEPQTEEEIKAELIKAAKNLGVGRYITRTKES